MSAKFFSDSKVNEFSGVFRGEGISDANEPIQAQFTGEPILGGQAFRIQFCTNNTDDQVLHEEETVLSADGMNGELKMFNFNTATGLTILNHSSEGGSTDKPEWQFSAGNFSDMNSLRMKVVLKKIGADTLEYTSELGLPGTEMKPRSAAVLKKY